MNYDFDLDDYEYIQESYVDDFEYIEDEDDSWIYEVEE